MRSSSPDGELVVISGELQAVLMTSPGLSFALTTAATLARRRCSGRLRPPPLALSLPSPRRQRRLPADCPTRRTRSQLARHGADARGQDDPDRPGVVHLFGPPCPVAHGNQPSVSFSWCSLVDTDHGVRGVVRRHAPAARTPTTALVSDQLLPPSRLLGELVIPHQVHRSDAISPPRRPSRVSGETPDSGTIVPFPRRQHATVAARIRLFVGRYCSEPRPRGDAYRGERPPPTGSPRVGPCSRGARPAAPCRP